MNPRTIRIAIFALVFALLSGVFAQGTLERAREQGFVRVGFANEVPYAYANPDGTLTGEAVEVARVILQRLGIPEMDGVLTEFGSLIPGLQARRFDIITAGMYVVPVRCEQVAFADPEYRIGEGLVVAEGNPLNLNSYADIAADPDVRVGTGNGWFEYDFMVEVGVSEDQISIFRDAASGMAGIQSGRIDAFTGTSLTMRNAADRTNGVEFVEEFEQPDVEGTPSYGAAAFRQADQDFVDAYNAELAKLKESGELAEIIGEFGFGPTELPGDVTAAQLCNAE